MPNESKKGPTKLSFGFEKRGTGNADLGQYEKSLLLAQAVVAYRKGCNSK
jgi:hypothetical protein